MAVRLELESLEYDRDDGTWKAEFTVRDSQNLVHLRLAEFLIGARSKGVGEAPQEVTADEALPRLQELVRKRLKTIGEAI